MFLADEVDFTFTTTNPKNILSNNLHSLKKEIENVEDLYSASKAILSAARYYLKMKSKHENSQILEKKLTKDIENINERYEEFLKKVNNITLNFIPLSDSDEVNIKIETDFSELQLALNELQITNDVNIEIEQAREITTKSYNYISDLNHYYNLEFGICKSQAIEYPVIGGLINWYYSCN